MASSAETPRLTELQSAQLVEQAGNEALFEHMSAGVPEAREKLAENNLPLAEYIARGYTYGLEEYEDLRQVACIGLLKSIDRFDPAKGVEFGVYAALNIRGEIKRHFRDHAWKMHVPRAVQENGAKLAKTMNRITAETGRSCTIEAAAQQLGMNPADAADAWLARIDLYDMASLDQAYENHNSDGDFESFLDTIPANTEVADQGTDKVLAVQILERLSGFRHLDRKIFILRTVYGKSQPEIARIVGVSQMQVSRLYRRTVSRLQEELSEDEPLREAA